MSETKNRSVSSVQLFTISIYYKKRDGEEGLYKCFNFDTTMINTFRFNIADAGFMRQIDADTSELVLPHRIHYVEICRQAFHFDENDIVKGNVNGFTNGRKTMNGEKK